VFVGDEDEVASDFEFGSIPAFVHEMHPDRNSGMFVLVLGYEEKGDEKLRQREIRPIGFVRVVEVQVSPRSFLRRTEADRVINGPERTLMTLKRARELKPSDGQRENGEASVLNEFIIRSPVQEEIDGEQRVGDMTRRDDSPDEELK
jgi:hypothetical protein